MAPGVGQGKLTLASIPEAAKYLGIKQEVAYWLVRHQMLHAQRLPRKKGLGLRIHRDEIKRFRQQFIFGTEIARQIGRSPKKTQLLLADQGIQAIIPDSIDPCRQLFFERTPAIVSFIARQGEAPDQVFALTAQEASPGQVVGKSGSIGQVLADRPIEDQ